MLGAILGIIGSLIPSLIKIWQDRQDKKHELELLKLQMEYAEKSHQWKTEEIMVEKEGEALKALYEMSKIEKFKPLGIKSIDIITRVFEVLIYVWRSAVQPNVTYLLLIYYGFVKYGQYKVALSMEGISSIEALMTTWSGFDYEILGFAITFWFGGRLFQRAGQYKER